MNGVSKLSVCDDIALVTFNKIGADLKFISAVFTDFAKQGINIDMISQSAPTGDLVSVSFTVAGEDLIKVLALTNKYKAQYPDIKPLVSSSNSKVQLFGEEMRNMEGVAAKAISTVAGADAHVLMITTSEVDISLLLTAYNLEQTIELLETEFGVKAQR
ncbi:ACT domain-containing protein [Hydrogenoanaerobacterium sp.]|uniref:ACT domain-containing protein n=1 Tax=Hydrogenoanaerobacterium sp. TaxID=2953763 RepID=UPI00289D0397|nr:ACT domain-containing protein [Hydrogenoanaerobacterium sp.]